MATPQPAKKPSNNKTAFDLEAALHGWDTTSPQTTPLSYTKLANVAHTAVQCGATSRRGLVDKWHFTDKQVAAAMRGDPTDLADDLREKFIKGMRAWTHNATRAKSGLRNDTINA